MLLSEEFMYAVGSDTFQICFWWCLHWSCEATHLTKAPGFWSSLRLQEPTSTQVVAITWQRLTWDTTMPGCSQVSSHQNKSHSAERHVQVMLWTACKEGTSRKCQSCRMEHSHVVTKVTAMMIHRVWIIIDRGLFGWIYSCCSLCYARPLSRYNLHIHKTIYARM